MLISSYMLWYHRGQVQWKFIYIGQQFQQNQKYDVDQWNTPWVNLTKSELVSAYFQFWHSLGKNLENRCTANSEFTLELGMAPELL